MNLIKAIWSRITAFFSNQRNVFLLGLLVTLVATSLEVFRGRASNYYVYSDAVKCFWDGISPYTMQFVDDHGRYFLYLPPFAVIFAPILLLPQYIGAFAWNVGNYVLMYLAVRTLPEPLRQHRDRIFLFLLPILLQSVFCYQYNVVVCYIFLFAFTLLEKDKPLWAILLIMVSACTKIYGGIELALLFCYPKVWRNMGFAILCGVVLMLSPLLNLGFDHPLGLYQEMADILATHNSTSDWAGILYTHLLKPVLLPNSRLVQAGVLAVLGAVYLSLIRQRNSFTFRVSALAIVMGFIILFSDAPETHTYIIALTGYQMAFWLMPSRSRCDWTLYWLLFACFCIIPIDVLCPPAVWHFVRDTLNLDIYIFTLCWLYLIWITIRRPHDVNDAHTL